LIRDDEVAAQAMGINTRNTKLLAFGMGACFGGVAGAMFAALQGYVSPESFSLQESVMIVAMVVFGGIGHIPGVILGAVLLTALPEILRYVVGPLQEMTDGRLDAGILRQLLIALASHDRCHAAAPARPVACAGAWQVTAASALTNLRWAACSVQPAKASLTSCFRFLGH
jgi:hypothetical protein